MSEQFKSIFPESLACEALWEYPVVNLSRNEVRNCCRTPPRLLDAKSFAAEGSEVFQNSKEVREERARMLLGEKIKSCESCWKMEAQRVRSPRRPLDVTRHLKETQLPELKNSLAMLAQKQRLDFLAKHDITFSSFTDRVELMLSNTCDMQCVYCNSHYSTKWAAEEAQYQVLPRSITNTPLDKKLSDDLKESFLKWFQEKAIHTTYFVNFLGGEPTLIPAFYETSSYIANLFKAHPPTERFVTLVIITNLNCTPVIFNKFVQHLREVAPVYGKIEVKVSIDGAGAQAEYIRYGLNWLRWQKNFESLIALKLDKVNVSVIPATNLLSITTLPRLLKYLLSVSRQHQVEIPLRRNVITDPEALSPSLLTPEFVPYLNKSIRVLKNCYKEVATFEPRLNSWEYYIYFLKSIRQSIAKHELTLQEKNKIAEYLNRFNRRKGIDIYQIFPEYSEFFRSCHVEQNTASQILNPLYKVWQRWRRMYSQRQVSKEL